MGQCNSSHCLVDFLGTPDLEGRQANAVGLHVVHLLRGKFRAEIRVGREHSHHFGVTGLDRAQDISALDPYLIYVMGVEKLVGFRVALHVRLAQQIPLAHALGSQHASAHLEALTPVAGCSCTVTR